MKFEQVILPCDDSPEMYQIVGIHASCQHYQKFKTFKKSQKVA